jgi:AcrR family transcriptional regulator
MSTPDVPHLTPGSVKSQATRDSILDAAERLFAERGVAGTSIRDITAAAQTNLGAINYHFGSKHELVGEVFRRRLEPVSERRAVLLQAAKEGAGDQSPTVEALLDALIRPVAEQSYAHGKRDTAFMRLMGRLQSEPDPEVERLLRLYSDTIIGGFGAALRVALPQLPPDELSWRMRFTMGALHHALLTASMQPPPKYLRGRLDADGLTRRLVAFAAAGLQAPEPRSEK